MKRFLKTGALVIVVIAITYCAGPRLSPGKLSPELPLLSHTLETAEQNIAAQENMNPVKPDNESRIWWTSDSLPEKTPYCLLYLHGFSASWYEGYPVNKRFAERYGMNAYLPRLAAHGLEMEDPLLGMSPEALYESAKEALATARLLGEKVIIMSTSTGGTLSLKLAADFPELVDGLILFSPNIRINNGAAFLLSRPWGLQVARLTYGSKYRITNTDFDSKDCQYWNCRYRLEAVVYLQHLVDATMHKKTYREVTVPVFLGYYYKDQQHQDPTVRVAAMQHMYEWLGTSHHLKRQQAFPGAGAHVIGCELTSGAVDQVTQACFQFAEEVLLLSPLP